MVYIMEMIFKLFLTVIILTYLLNCRLACFLFRKELKLLMDTDGDATPTTRRQSGLGRFSRIRTSPYPTYSNSLSGTSMGSHCTSYRAAAVWTTVRRPWTGRILFTSPPNSGCTTTWKRCSSVASLKSMNLCLDEGWNIIEASWLKFNLVWYNFTPHAHMCDMDK